MTLILVSGDAIAEAAMDALTAPGYEALPGYCQRWVREVVQSLYGGRFDHFWSSSAAASLVIFQQQGSFVLNPASPISRGDLLYKAPALSGRAGHVAIMGQGGLICENSSYHWNPGEAFPDARGTRSASAFGPFSAIVRLSLANKLGGLF